jgi:hypothetical protein
MQLCSEDRKLSNRTLGTRPTTIFLLQTLKNSAKHFSSLGVCDLADATGVCRLCGLPIRAFPASSVTNLGRGYI